MMLQAMKKRRQGVAGLPANNLRRADYAGGGIVAFSGEDGSFVGGSTFDAFMPDSSSGGESQKATQEQIAMMSLSELQEYYRSGKIPDRLKGPIAQQRQTSPTETPPKAEPAAPPRQAAPAAPRGAAPAAESAAGLPAVLQKALGLNFDTLYEAPEKRSIDTILGEQKRRQGLAGISEDYLDEREKRLGDIQSKREAARAQQPMEQLSTFLTSIAEGRGGNWATQGARGAKASRELRAQQEALRDKQDLEMEELKFTVAAKRDAIRRGDLGTAEALEKEERRLRQDVAKDRAQGILKQAEIESLDRYRTGSLGIEGRKASAMEKSNTFNQAVQQANAEADRIRKGLEKRLESGMDSELRKRVKENPGYIEEQAEAARNRVLGGYGFGALPGGAAPAPSAGGGVPVRLPDGRTMYFPNQQAADQFKSAAGIR
jgi:hypothetical protein